MRSGTPGSCSAPAALQCQSSQAVADRGPAASRRGRRDSARTSRRRRAIAPGGRCRRPHDRRPAAGRSRPCGQPPVDRPQRRPGRPARRRSQRGTARRGRRRASAGAAERARPRERGEPAARARAHARHAAASAGRAALRRAPHAGASAAPGARGRSAAARPSSNSRPSASSRRRTSAGSPSAVRADGPVGLQDAVRAGHLLADEAAVERAGVGVAAARRAGDVAVAHPGAGRDRRDDLRQQRRGPWGAPLGVVVVTARGARRGDPPPAGARFGTKSVQLARATAGTA